MIVAALLPIAIILIIMNTVSDASIKEVFMGIGAISMLIYFTLMFLSPKIVTNWLDRSL